MNEIAAAFPLAFRLIAGLDAELLGIVALSLQVSLSAAVIAFILGVPMGAALAVRRFAGRRFVLVVVNALLGLPPVVAGLVVYLLISRAGPLGSLGLVFTPTAMVMAQTLLALPIVIALSHRAFAGLWAEFGDHLRVDGASPLQALRTLAAIGRASFVTVFLTAFGRAIAEVGAIIMVGGNIRGYTRTMTTTIALETSKGELALALALGIILIALSLAVTTVAFLMTRQALDR